MSDKMREALEHAVKLVDDDVIRVCPSDRQALLDWLTLANEALAQAEQPKPKLAYYETHEPPHCPTCGCGLPAQAEQRGEVAQPVGHFMPDFGRAWCMTMAKLEAGHSVTAGRYAKPLADACRLPPDGWLCTRDPGHDGPCAAASCAPPAPVVPALTPVGFSDLFAAQFEPLAGSACSDLVKDAARLAAACAFELAFAPTVAAEGVPQ